MRLFLDTLANVQKPVYTYLCTQFLAVFTYHRFRKGLACFLSATG